MLHRRPPYDTTVLPKREHSLRQDSSTRSRRIYNASVRLMLLKQFHCSMLSLGAPTLALPPIVRYIRPQ